MSTVFKATKSLAQCASPSKVDVFMKELGANMWDPTPVGQHDFFLDPVPGESALQRALAWMRAHTIRHGRCKPYAVDEHGNDLRIERMAADLGWNVKWAQEVWRERERFGLFMRDQRFSGRLYLTGRVPRLGSSSTSGDSDGGGGCTTARSPLILPACVQRQIANWSAPQRKAFLARLELKAQFARQLARDAMAQVRAVIDDHERSLYSEFGLERMPGAKRRKTIEVPLVTISINESSQAKLFASATRYTNGAATNAEVQSPPDGFLLAPTGAVGQGAMCDENPTSARRCEAAVHGATNPPQIADFKTDRSLPSTPSLRTLEKTRAQANPSSSRSSVDGVEDRELTTMVTHQEQTLVFEAMVPHCGHMIPDLLVVKDLIARLTQSKACELIDSVSPVMTEGARKWIRDLASQFAAAGILASFAFSMEVYNPPAAMRAKYLRYAGGVVAPGADVYLEVPSHQMHFGTRVRNYLKQMYKECADEVAAAGLPVVLQFGETQWWYFDNRWADPQGGMPFYDQETIDAFAAAKGHQIWPFTSNTDDPAGDPAHPKETADFLRDRIWSYCQDVISYVRASHPAALFECLWPLDANQGKPGAGTYRRLLMHVNLPREWQNSSYGIKYFRCEGFDYDIWQKNATLMGQTIRFAAQTLGRPASECMYLAGLYGPPDPPMAQAYGMWVQSPFYSMSFWAFDQFCLNSRPIPLEIWVQAVSAAYHKPRAARAVEVAAWSSRGARWRRAQPLQVEREEAQWLTILAQSTARPACTRRSMRSPRSRWRRRPRARCWLATRRSTSRPRPEASPPRTASSRLTTNWSCTPARPGRSSPGASVERSGPPPQATATAWR